MIPLADVIDFLSQAAPRPWVTRMLHAMLLNDEIQAFFLSGRIRSEVMVAEMLSFVEGVGLEPHSDVRDALVREKLSDTLADMIKEKDWNETFVEYDEQIEPIEGFVFAPMGFIHYGTFDWETGDLVCEYLPDKRERPDHLFQDAEELIATEYSRNDVTAEFRGMHLAREKIELMLPTHRLSSGDGKGLPIMPEAKRVGRPAKWDWEGALTYIVSQAQTPDGLPTGPGAQAKIETIMAEWFEGQTGSSPSISQIRVRASTIIRLIEKS